MKEYLPVIMTDGLRDALHSGSIIEVECTKTPERKYNSHSGEWRLYVLTEKDGEVVRESYVHGRDVKTRLFNTVTGLISFAVKMGINVVGVPMEAGLTAEWELAHNEDDT